jgi:cytoskeletal protein CcmA (bactofilin family)
MFTTGSKSESDAPSTSSASTRAKSGEASVISPDLKITGNLESNGDIHIKGTVEGDIRSRSVTVGEGAKVSGAIIADTVQISGALDGQVEAPNVTIARSAKVHGDVVHQTLSIEAGAHIEGQCRRLDTRKATAQSSVSPLKPTEEPTASGEKRAAGGA